MDTAHFVLAYMIPHTRRPAPKPPKNVPAIMLYKRLAVKHTCVQMEYEPTRPTRFAW